MASLIAAPWQLYWYRPVDRIDTDTQFQSSGGRIYIYVSPQRSVAAEVFVKEWGWVIALWPWKDSYIISISHYNFKRLCSKYGRCEKDYLNMPDRPVTTEKILNINKRFSLRKLTIDSEIVLHKRKRS